MMLHTEQMFEQWRIEKTMEDIEYELNHLSLEASEGEHSFVSNCESHAEQLRAELQKADQSTDTQDEEEPLDETTQHENHVKNEPIIP
jgi:hypothetical protein